MELKQNPFSLYDFLGYFLPGGAFLYGCFGLAAAVKPGFHAFSAIAESLGVSEKEAYLPFVIASYSLGLILSFVSSVTVERYSIWRFGYPSKYLLGFPPRPYFEVDEPATARKVFRIAVGVFLFPVMTLDLLIGERLGMRELYARVLDEWLVELLKERLNCFMKATSRLDHLEQFGQPKKHDYFRYVYHYTVENAPAHRPKMQNYVALYGFCRTLCLLAVCFFWLVCFAGVSGSLTLVWLVVLLLALWLLSFLSFVGFAKFYRRFSLESLMALSVITAPPGMSATNA